MAIPISRPVVYKGFVINVTKHAEDKYVFAIEQVVEMKLSGVASSLPHAFEKARAMIDKITEDHEDD